MTVRAIFQGEEAHEVVGTYASSLGMRRAGGFYNETEFDLAALAPIRSRTAELGCS